MPAGLDPVDGNEHRAQHGSGDEEQDPADVRGQPQHQPHRARAGGRRRQVRPGPSQRHRALQADPRSEEAASTSSGP